MKIIKQTVIGVIVIIHLFNQSTQQTIPNNLVQVDSKFKFYYQFSSQQAYFMLEASQKSWFSVAFGKGMNNVDMVVLEIDNNNIKVTDYYSSSYSKPTKDTQQDLTITKQELQSDKYKVYFQRKMDTADQSDTVLKPQTQWMSFAWGNPGVLTMAYHKSNSKQIQLQLDSNGNLISSTSDDSFKKSGKLHGTSMKVMWVYLSDIGIFSARFLRTFRYYLVIHYVVFSLAVGVTLFSGISMYLLVEKKGIQWTDGLKTHFTVALIVMIVIVLQTIFGFILWYLRKKQKISKGQQILIYLLKQSHFYFGYMIYILAKITAILGSETGLSDHSHGLGGNIVGSFSLMIILIVWEVIYRFMIKLEHKKVDTNNCVTKTSIKCSFRTNKQQEIQRLLESVDTNTVDVGNLDFNWCYFRDDILYFGDYDHPGGNSFFQHVRGREVSRFLFGVQGLESDLNLDLKFDIIHTHRTVFINSMCLFKVAQLKPLDKSIIVLTDTLQPQTDHVIQHNDTHIPIKQYQQVSYSNYSAIAIKNRYWEYQQIINISGKLNLYYFTNPNFKVRIANDQISLFGKHFELSFNGCCQHKVRLYTAVLSMTHENQQMLKNLDPNQIETLLKNQHDNQYSLNLPLLIKTYDAKNALSLKISQHYSNNLQIQGPFGNGLDLNQYKKSKAIIFGGGTGYLPFLDMVDYLYKFNLLKKNNGSSELMSSYCQLEDMEIQFNLAFQNIGEFINYKQIVYLLENSQKYSLNLKVKEGTENLNEFDQYLVQQNFDSQFIEQKCKLDGAEIVYICGPQRFNKTVYRTLVALDYQGKISFV